MGLNKNNRGLRKKVLFSLLALIMFVTVPLGVYGGSDVSHDHSKKGETEVDKSLESEGSEFLMTDSNGSVQFEGESLYMEKDGKAVPADLNYLLKSGRENVELKTKSEVKADIEKGLFDKVASIFLPSKVHAKAPKIVYKGKVHYRGSIVGEFRVNGELAFCLQHHKPTPGTGEKYQTPLTYNNKYIQRALYYGWGGDANIFKNKSQGMVVTSLVLDRIYEGGTTGRNLPGYSKLWDKVKNGRAPDSDVNLSDRYLTSYVKSGKQISQSTKLKADKKNKVKIKAPSKVTIRNLSNGKKTTGGTITINGGQSFRLEAPLDYSATIKRTLKGSMKKFQPMITKPSRNKSLQVLGYSKMITDPDDKINFTAKFVKRKRDVTIHYKDYHTKKKLKRSYKTEQTIGTCKTYKSSKTLKNGGKYYDRTGSSSYKVCVNSKNVTKTFYYKLRRDVTVNYLDDRTGDKIKDSKNYTVHRGDKYSENHPTIKKGDKTYHYVKKTGDAEKGTIDTKDIEINYHYNLPLAELGLKKIQIYTDKSDKGLPVKVELDKKYNYSTKIKDMIDKDKTVDVALYQGDKKLDSKEYNAKKVPEKLEFKISPKVLKVNTHKPYTVKFEGYDKEDFEVKKGHEELTTDGYTSSEKTVDVSSKKEKELNYKGVVMTEREVEKDMKVYYETLSIPVKKIERMRTGYGFHMPIDLTYENEIGNFKPEFSFNMMVPDDLIDEKYIEYETNKGTATVPLEITEYDLQTKGDAASSKQKFELQHVNVEDHTGHLFTDEQVANKDKRIELELIDGGRKFYLPIWGRIGDYPVSVESDKKIGINQINIEIHHIVDVYAHMYAHMDSETIEDDAIIMEPVNIDDPFPYGVPKSWTKEEVEEFKEILKK